MKHVFWSLFLSAILLLNPTKILAKSQKSAKANIYDHTYRSIDGSLESFRTFKGKVMLLVNTASECGYTGQYGGLERLYQKYKDKGFVVVGFPCNDFGGQEPGNNKEIKKFCKLNYGVTFPLSRKIHVKGQNQDPLYYYLTGQIKPKKEVAWNFEKFLIDKKGNVVLRFPSHIRPMSKVMRKAIESHL